MAKTVLKGLSLRSIGLFYIMHKYPGINKVAIMDNYCIGEDAIRAIYKELVNADMIQFKPRKGYVVANKLNITAEIKDVVPEKIKVYKDSPKKRIEQALKFYDDELEASIGKRLNTPYANLLTFLTGNNDSGKRLDHILQLSHQVSYKEFEKLVAKAAEKGRNLKDLLKSMENDKSYTKNKENLYLTLNSWLNRD